MPVQTRSERFTSVEHDAFPEVTGFEAEWKLTPVDKVRALIDGELDGAPYAILYPEAAGTDVQWIDRGDALIGTAGAPEERAAANAWSSFEKALHIRLSGDAENLTVTRTGLGHTPRAAHTISRRSSVSSAPVRAASATCTEPGVYSCTPRSSTARSPGRCLPRSASPSAATR